MSSIFDVPSGLLFVLSLVTSNPSDVATAATGIAAPKASVTLNLAKAPCRHSEQAWLAALKNGAGGSAFSTLAGRIFRTTGGRYYVPVAQDRAEILKLQGDSAVSCFIALSSAAANAAHLKADLGRDATLSDLYLAHVLGRDLAQRILIVTNKTPRVRLAKQFPNLDRKLPGLYRGKGKHMTLQGFSGRLQRAIRQQVAKASGTKVPATREPQRIAQKTKKTAQERLRKLVQKTNSSGRDGLGGGRAANSNVAALSREKQDARQKKLPALRFGFAENMPKVDSMFGQGKRDQAVDL